MLPSIYATLESSSFLMFMPVWHFQAVMKIPLKMLLNWLYKFSSFKSFLISHLFYSLIIFIHFLWARVYGNKETNIQRRLYSLLGKINLFETNLHLSRISLGVILLPEFWKNEFIVTFWKLVTVYEYMNVIIWMANPSGSKFNICSWCELTDDEIKCLWTQQL